MKHNPYEWRSAEVEHRQSLQRLDCYPWIERDTSWRTIVGWSVTISMLAATLLGFLIITGGQ